MVGEPCQTRIPNASGGNPEKARQERRKEPNAPLMSHCHCRRKGMPSPVTVMMMILIANADDDGRQRTSAIVEKMLQLEDVPGQRRQRGRILKTVRCV